MGLFLYVALAYTTQQRYKKKNLKEKRMGKTLVHDKKLQRADN
jgi:hypothetical protein